MSRLKGVNGYIWTEQELSFLLENYTGFSSIKPIAETLDRSPASIKSKAHKLGLSVNYGTRLKRWTQEELDFLDEKMGNSKLL